MAHAPGRGCGLVLVLLSLGLLTYCATLLRTIANAATGILSELRRQRDACGPGPTT